MQRGSALVWLILISLLILVGVLGAVLGTSLWEAGKGPSELEPHDGKALAGSLLERKDHREAAPTPPPRKVRKDPGLQAAPENRMAFSARLRGRLVDPEGKPLPGVTIRLGKSGTPGDILAIQVSNFQGTPLSHKRVTRTRKTGEFVFKDLDPEETYVLDVHEIPYAPCKKQLNALSYPALTDLGDIRLQAGPVVSGLCLEAGGKPVEGAWVRIVRVPGHGSLRQYEIEALARRENTGLRVVTDAKGRFRLEGVPVGSVVVMAGKSGCITATSREFPTASGQEVKKVRLVLEPGKRITGVVVDASGKGLEGIAVNASSLEKRGREGRKGGYGGSAISGTGGRFLMEGLRPGRFRLSAWLHGHKAVSLEALSGQENVRFLFEVQKPVALEGKVVARGSGDPIPGARVWLALPGKGAPDTCTDGEGRFRLEAQPWIWGRNVIVACAEGYVRGESAPISFDPGGRKPGEILLHLVRGASILGRVVGAGDRSPLGGASVFLRRSASGNRGIPGSGGGILRYLSSGGAGRSLDRTLTGSDGTFCFPVVGPGVYDLEVRHVGHAEGRYLEIEVVEGVDRADIEVVLGRGGKFTGTVFFDDGGRAEGITVVVVDGNNREKSRVTDSGGAFCFDRLAAGWYRIIVLEPGETRRQSRLGRVHSPVGPGAPGAAENTMQVVEAGEVVRTFTVERGVRVEGTVHGIGEPPTLCRIIFRPYEPLRSRITSGVVQEPGTTNRDRGTCPDGEGRYCIDSVKSGQYKVSLRVLGHRGQRQGSYIVLSRIVDIPRVPTLMLDLNLPSGSISGRVLSPEMDRDLASLPRMRITRTDGDDRYVRTLQVNDDGTYTFDHLRPGTYGIMVFKSDTWAAMSRPGVRVEQGVQVTGVDFQLLSGVVAAGVVVDETGRPVARASVRAVPEGEEARRLNPFGHGRTRSDGTFSIAQLLPGTYAFRAHKLRRHSETIKVVIPEKGGTSNIRLVLNQGMR